MTVAFSSHPPLASHALKLNNSSFVPSLCRRVASVGPVGVISCHWLSSPTVHIQGEFIGLLPVVHAYLEYVNADRSTVDDVDR